MTLTELARALESIGISPATVALGGHADYAWSVEQSPEGRWEVYWYERGTKNVLVQLHTESDACFQLLGRLTYSQLLAGVIGVK